MHANNVSFTKKFKVTVLLKLPDSRLQYFVHSSVSVNTSQGIWRGIGATPVNSCYIYSLLRTPHSFRSYKSVNIKTDQDKVAVTVCSPLRSFPNFFSLSGLKFDCAVLESPLSRQQAACRTVNPKNIFSKKITSAYRYLPL